MRVDRGRPGAFSSGAFRFALLLAAVFAAGSALLLWAMHREVDTYATEATNSMLRSEAAALTDEYRAEGLSALIDEIDHHARAPGSPFGYVLVGPNGQRLAGNLPQGNARSGWQTRIAGEPGDQHARMRHLGTPLPGGLILTVATDTFDIEATRDRLQDFTLAWGIGITLFALVGGMLAGRIFLARLDRINRAVSEIVAGNSGERVPRIGVGPEFDVLAGNLNLMLDRNAAAMDGLRQVSAAVAHDLRTPLARLKQHLEAMRETSRDGPETIDAAIDTAVDQIDDVLATFQALLRIGMLEGGVGRQRFVAVELGEIMDRVCSAYAPVAEDAGHRLSANHPAGIFVSGDGEMLAQLFANIIENALAHTPPGTSIRSSLAVEHGLAVASVRDDGPGLAGADPNRLFDKFYRGDPSRGSPGSGLGLALVAAIAELHGGRCRIVPAAVGLWLEIAFPTDALA